MAPDNNQPTSEQLETWAALDELEKCACTGSLSEVDQERLVDKFFSFKSKMRRLERLRKRKNALISQLTTIEARESQLLSSLGIN